MAEERDSGLPFHPGALDGIERIRIDCDDLDLTVETDPSLANVIHLTVGSGTHAPSMMRDAGEIVIHQRGRYRGGTATLLLPDTGCPPISGTHEKGDLHLERVNAPVTLKHASGDVRVAGGEGDVRLDLGKGELVISAREGGLELSLGQGDVRVARCSGPTSIALGKGDITIDTTPGDIAVKLGAGDIQLAEAAGMTVVSLGSGDIGVTRPRGMRLVTKLGGGDLTIKSGSLTGLVAKLGKGDIVSTAHLVFPPPAAHREEAVPDPARRDDAPPRERMRGIRAQGIDFEAGDKGLRISSKGFELEAGEDGVRIVKGGMAFEAGERGVRIVRGDPPDDGAFNVMTGSGDIVLNIPAGVPMRVEALVNGGDIQSDVPLVSVGRPGPRGTTQRFVGVTDPQSTDRLNLQVRTDRGDIRLRSVASVVVPPSPPIPPVLPVRPVPSVPPVSPPRAASSVSPDADTARIPAPLSRDQQLRAVLDALSRGEITVADADRMIADIERG